MRAPIERLRELIILQRKLIKKYLITNEQIYCLEYDLNREEREKMKTQPSMNEDIQKYLIYKITPSKTLKRIFWITSTQDYNHGEYELHHFVRKSIRKNNLEFYSRVEHLQKLIYMTAQMNRDLENMGEDTFFKKYGIPKFDLVFCRRKWREGYYD